MSETRIPRTGTPSPEHDGPFAAVVKTLESILSLIGDHGTAEESLTGIARLENVISSLRYHQAALAHQAEINVVRANAQRGNLKQLNRGTAATIALARQADPHGYREYLENCRILFNDTPHLAAAYSRGEFTEAQMRAILTPLRIVKAERRTEFDNLYAKNPQMFACQGTRKISDTVQDFTLAYASDDQCKEQKSAEEQRRIKFTPHPATGMMSIHAELPIIAGLALKNDIKAKSTSLKAHGDERTRAQIEADYLASFCTSPDATVPINLSVGLIMTDKTLFLGDRQPAYLDGYGVIAPQYARELLAGQEILNNMTLAEMAAARPPAFIHALETTVELIRLYTAPGDRELIAMDSTARIFPEKMKKFIRTRDRRCRTPFCDGMIEEIDHVTQACLGGPTCVANADGRCKFCNQAKETPGWQEIVICRGPHRMKICTSMGPTYHSTAPPATGFAHQPYPQCMSEADWVRAFEDWLNQPPDTGSGPPDIGDIPA
ncbi:HNH endonuclease [Glutamicibacter sp. TV12E]|uniref:HNH endonuclease n=1 Tax=Glutamicibacter sp. TV12E TaxID=3446362 RepID=UPI004033D256